MAYAKEYLSWVHMKERCFYKSNRSYGNYGGRGITVCKSWKDSFSAFIADVGEMPSPGHQLERIDVNGNYEPGNVRWATAAEQARNKRNSVYITLNGERLHIIDWAHRYGIAPNTIYGRLKYNGWTVEAALTTPASSGNRRKAN